MNCVYHRRLRHQSIFLCLGAMLCVLGSASTAGATGFVDQQGDVQRLNIPSLHATTVHDGTRQTTVWSPTVYWTPGTSKILLIIPVPAALIHAGTIEQGVAHDLSRLIVLKRSNPAMDKGAGAASYVPLHGTRLKAKLDIQYTPEFGPGALKWLQTWADKHKAKGLIATVPKASMEYYTQRKWSFVGVSYEVPRAWKGPAKGSAVNLEPFTLSFESPRTVLPLKWPWSTTPMTVRVDSFHLKPPKQAAYSEMAKHGWEVAGLFGFPYLGPSPKRALTTKLPKISPGIMPSRLRKIFRPWIKKDAPLHVRTMVAPSLEGAAAPSKWPEDWALPALKPGTRLEANTAKAKRPPMPPLKKRSPTNVKPGNVTPTPTSSALPTPSSTPKAAPAPKASSCAQASGQATSPWFLLGACVMFMRVRRRRKRS